jgi:Na+/melibiose symporter-like transporter
MKKGIDKAMIAPSLIATLLSVIFILLSYVAFPGFMNYLEDGSVAAKLFAVGMLWGVSLGISLTMVAVSLYRRFSQS